MKHAWLHSIVMLSICLLAALPAKGQTARSAPGAVSGVIPVAQPISQSISQSISQQNLQATAATGAAAAEVQKADQTAENEPLRITDRDVKAAGAHNSASSAPANPASDLTRILISLIVVIGLIFLLRAALKHFSALPGINRGTRLVTVLSRSVVSPKQQVMVLQVGKRLLIVGDSGGQMSALCEIHDPDEIASLVGQARQSSASVGSKVGAFGKMFRHANENFDEGEILQSSASNSVIDREASHEVDPDDEVSAEEVGGLLDKVRMLQQQFNDSKPALKPPSAV